MDGESRFREGGHVHTREVVGLENGMFDEDIASSSCYYMIGQRP